MALTTNLVSYWKLDESSGNAADSVGSNTLTNSNVTYSTGKINNGAVFNGTSADLRKTGLVPNTGNGAWSVSAWFKTSTTDKLLVACGTESSAQAIIMYVHTHKLASNAWATSEAAGTVTVDNNAWHHGVATYDGAGTITVYTDGGDAHTASVGTLNVTAGGIPFAVGSEGDGTGWWNGSIDEVGIWSRALSSGEVSQLYNGGSGLQYPFSQSLTLSCTAGSYTLTGGTNTLGRLLTMVVSAGQYILTGVSTALSMVRGWSTQSKNSSSWSNESKNTSSWNNQPK